MARTYRLTRTLVLVAFAAVLLAGALIVRGVREHVSSRCEGSLLLASPHEVGGAGRARLVRPAERLEIVSEQVMTPEGTQEYRPHRVVWRRSNTVETCADLPLPRDRKLAYELKRDEVSGAFLVTHSDGVPLFAFRKTEERGTRFHPERLVAPNNLGALVLLVALGAITLALSKLALARPYATRLGSWQSATLRADGLVESPTGATLGRIGPRVYTPAGDVLVDPSAYEGRDVYREMPMLARGQVAAGTHERWTEGTLRRLRDARTLALLATGTTALSVLAHYLSARG